MKTDSRILQEILALAKTELEKEQNPDMGYTTPDGKYHIFIYKDQEHSWDDGPAPYSFYVVEPNKVVNGAHEPLGDTFLTESLDLSELIVGCQWCLEQFEADRTRNLTTKDRAMELFNETMITLDKDPDAYFVAMNLMHLHSRLDEVPLEKLYHLADRLNACFEFFSQPLTQDELAHAVASLLEDAEALEEYDTCPSALTPEQTLEFLLSCDASPFAFVVEQTAVDNLMQLSFDSPTREQVKSLEDALKAFQSNLEKPSLDQQISSAAGRASEQSKPPAKSQTIEK